MTQKRKKATQLNKDYFQSLIATRASLGHIQLYVAGAIFGAIFLGIFWGMGVTYGWNSPYEPFSMTLIVTITYMLLWSFAIAVPPFKRKVYQRQDLAGFFQTVFIIFLTIELALASLFLSSLRVGKYKFYTHSTGIIFILFVCIYFLSLLYNVFWIKNQLRTGFSKERTELNFLAKPVGQGVTSISLIFGGSMLGKYMTTSQTNIFGIGAGLLFIIVFSRVTVEYAYAAVLKWRDRSYWEEYEAPEALTDKQKRKIIWVFVTLLEVVIVACIGHFNEELLKMSQLISIPIAILMLAIFADWIIRFVRWIRKK